MAKIGNIKLTDKNEGFNAGAAFLIQKPSPIDSIVLLDNKTIVEVKKGNPYIVVRTNGLKDYQSTFDYGHEFVQQGLDILSITGQADLGTRNTTDENIVWWAQNENISLRITDTSNNCWDINASGNIMPANGIALPSKSSHHMAYRYFRLSQITNDLFDSYRNLYLAFELLASSAISRIKNEPEKDWLERYLGTKNEIIKTDLEVFNDTIQSFCDQIYKKARCPLFHAKQGSDFLSPNGKAHERLAVSDALRKLRRIFIILVKEQDQTIRGFGANMSTGLIQALMAPLLDNTFFILSTDLSPFNPDEMGFDNVRYQHCIKSDKAIKNTSAMHEFSILGNIKNIEPNSTFEVRRIELVDESQSLCTTILEEPLCINEIDTIEIQSNHQLTNAKALKQRYAR